MALYINDGGVVRQAGLSKFRQYGNAFWTLPLFLYARGPDGTPQQCYNFADFVTSAEFRLTGIWYDGDLVDWATAQQHGTITVNNNGKYVKLSTSELNHELRLGVNCFLHLSCADLPLAPSELGNIIENKFGNALPFSVSVTGTVTGSRHAYNAYQNKAFSENVVNGSFSESKTVTRVFTNSNPSTLNYFDTLYLESENTGSGGTVTNQMTVNSFALNGRSIPITVTNGLT